MGGKCSIWGQERRKRINKFRDTDQGERMSREKPENMATIEIKCLEGHQNGKREMSKHMYLLLSQQHCSSKNIKNYRLDIIY